jgi:putative tricarboxylic transport membrane protein
VSAVLGASAARGLASLFIGLAIGLVGLDTQTGQARFTLGIPELLDGIDVVVVAVGLFAVGETLYIATYLNRRSDQLEQMKGSIWMSRADWKRSWKPWLRGTAFGFPFGMIPAGGAEIPTFLSYATEKKLARNPEEFGKGAIEGVAGPEAANNASATGTLVPLLTLGLPTTATAAIILAAFQQWGLQPGPLLFQTQPELIWGLIASMYIGNVMLLILNLPLVGIWVKLLEIPRPLLYAGILIFATLGAYGLRNSWFDLALLYGIGLLGFLMRRYDMPVAPVLVGMILGPLAEQQLRRALAISQGDLSIFVTQPISATVLAITALVLVGPPIWRRIARRRASP